MRGRHDQSGQTPALQPALRAPEGHQGRRRRAASGVRLPAIGVGSSSGAPWCRHLASEAEPRPGGRRVVRLSELAPGTPIPPGQAGERCCRMAQAGTAGLSPGLHCRAGATRLAPAHAPRLGAKHLLPARCRLHKLSHNRIKKTRAVQGMQAMEATLPPRCRHGTGSRDVPLPRARAAAVGCRYLGAPAGLVA